MILYENPGFKGRELTSGDGHQHHRFLLPERKRFGRSGPEVCAEANWRILRDAAAKRIQVARSASMGAFHRRV
jgi:hypothetical protein